MAQAVLDKNGWATTPGELTVYYFQSETKEYISERIIFLSLDEGIPAGCTIVAPAVVESGFVSCWGGAEWVKTENHRGETVYSELDGSPLEIKQLGPLPDGYTNLAPPALTQAGEALQWDGSAWQIIPPSAKQAAQNSLAPYYAVMPQSVGLRKPPTDAAVKWAMAQENIISISQNDIKADETQIVPAPEGPISINNPNWFS